MRYYAVIQEESKEQKRQKWVIDINDDYGNNDDQETVWWSTGLCTT